MSRAPGNDPFVVTVGALDQHETAAPGDDTRPEWSAYGWTMDGFGKPELTAPGRYMVMPAPMTSELATRRPDRVVADERLWMSGTSFAAPVVAGAAAQILSVHPDWRPDDVKGALMLSAHGVADGAGVGVGEIDAGHAALVGAPPNPNENLYAFVRRDPATNAPSLDASRWATTVAADPEWSTANWSGANWSGANWSGANWSGANWSGANWSGANWSGANWSGASWSQGEWTPNVSSATFSSEATDSDGADVE